MPGANATVNITNGVVAVNGANRGVSVGDSNGGASPSLTNAAVLNISGGTLLPGDHMQVGTNGCAGIVNQSGGLVQLTTGYAYFAIGDDSWNYSPNCLGTYNLSGGTLNVGYNLSSPVGFGGGTGVLNISGGVMNVSAAGGNHPLTIGSGDTDFGDPTGNGTLAVTGGTLNAYGNMTVGDAYAQGGGSGLFTLAGGVVDLKSSSILVGPGGTLAATSGTLQNVGEITNTAAESLMTLTKTGTGVLVIAGDNSYTGGTTVASGTVEFTSPEAVPTTGILNVGRSGSISLVGLLAGSGAAMSGDSVLGSDATAAVPDATSASDAAASEVAASESRRPG